MHLTVLKLVALLFCGITGFYYCLNGWYNFYVYRTYLSNNDSMVPNCTAASTSRPNNFYASNLSELVKILKSGSILSNSIGFLPKFESNRKYYHRKNRNFCQTYAPKIVIIVRTGTANFELRRNVREIWAKDYLLDTKKDSNGHNKDVLLVFSIGIPRNSTVAENLKKEEERYRDFLHIDVEDYYELLSYRGYAVMQWINDTCPSETRYFISVDDDVVLHVPSLKYFIKHRLKGDLAMYGYVWHKAVVVRDPKHRFYISKEDYAPNYYPDFASGPCIIIPRPTISRLLDTAKNIAPMRLDDVYFGIVAEMANIPFMQTGFELKYAPSRCHLDGSPVAFAYYSLAKDGYHNRADVEMVYRSAVQLNCTGG